MGATAIQWRAVIYGRVLLTAAVYALVVFIAGCVLGTLREFVVVPWVGRALALWIELPVMVVICYEVADRLLVRRTSAIFIGALALPILVGLETALAQVLNGDRSGTHWLLNQEIGALTVTLAGLAIFAAMPVFVGRMRFGEPISRRRDSLSPRRSIAADQR